MYAVVVNEGPAMADDNAVYFTKEEPQYIVVPFVADDDERTTKFGRFLRFVPTNGQSKGRITSVPVERVVSITEDNDTGLHSVKA